MFGSPEHTAYDLHFRLLNIPVRIHPLFWLVSAMIGGRGDLTSALVFVGCVFVSILVHEFGHGLSSRWLGSEPEGIVLYSMGGLCYSHLDRRTPWKKIVMIFCGPGAGFLLFLLVVAILNLLYGIHPADALAVIGIGQGDIMEVRQRLPESRLIRLIVPQMLWINLLWGLFNLLPLWPLDGGQITSTFLGKVNPRDGERWGHIIALLTAAAIVMWAISREDYYIAVFVGFIGFMNYQILQSMHDSYRANRDSDWGR